MAGIRRREPSAIEPLDVFGRLDRTFDDWMRLLPFRRPMTFTHAWQPADLIQVDEYHENGTLVVRAELPGIDPDKDVELTVVDGMLHIEAERRQEETTEKRGYLRKEIRYGSFARHVPLPEGATEADITASYNDGILEIRIPAPQPQPANKIEVTRG